MRINPQQPQPLDDYTRGRMYQNDICTPKLNHYKECLEALVKISEIDQNERFKFAMGPFVGANWIEALKECRQLAKEVLKGQP